jgi:hypothetical protein
LLLTPPQDEDLPELEGDEKSSDKKIEELS